MYKSFKSFRESRDIAEFGQKYEQLCKSISESHVSFDQFWEHHGFPFFINGGASSEQELLEGWGQAQYAQPPQQQPVQERPQLSDDAQSRASKAMEDIKQQFNKAMSTVVNQYKKSKDSVGYQLAKGFLDKVNSYAEKLKIQRGEGQFDSNATFAPPPQTLLVINLQKDS